MSTSKNLKASNGLLRKCLLMSMSIDS